MTRILKPIGHPVEDITTQSYYCKCGRAASHYKKHWYETPEGRPFDSYEYICEYCMEEKQKEINEELIETGLDPISLQEFMALENYKEL